MRCQQTGVRTRSRCHSILGRFLLYLPGLLLAFTVSADQTLNMYVFASVDCPHCEAQKPFLQQLEADNAPLHIEIFEVLRTDRHHQRFRNPECSEICGG